MKLFPKLLLAAGMVGMGLQPVLAQGFGSDHKVGLEFRTDYQYNDSDLDNKEDVNRATKNTTFKIARSRMKFTGKLNDLTSYYARIRFDRNYAQEAGSVDGTGPGLSILVLDRVLIKDILSLRVGKFSKKEGSWEEDYSGMDVYGYSQLSGFRAAPSEHTGVQLTAKAGSDHTFTLQVVNSQYPTGQSNQKALATLLGWDGRFAGEMVETLVTYNAFPSTKQRAGDKDANGNLTKLAVTEDSTSTAWGAGVRLNIPVAGNKLSLEGELDNVTKPEFDVMTSSTTAAKTTATTLENTFDAVILLARFHTKMLKPFIKYAADTEKVDSDDKAKYTLTQAGVEYFPDDDGLKTYRVHAVYTSTKFDCDYGFKTASFPSLSCNNPGKTKNSDDHTTTQFNVGVSARFN